MLERREALGGGGGSIGQHGRKVIVATSRNQPRAARRYFPARGSAAAGPAAAALVCVAAVLCGLAPAGEALVSYCRDSSPHSYSLQQAEVICETEGEYNFRLVVDKSNQRNLYDDLGEQNVGRRFTAMTLDEKTVAKYANLSEFVLHVEVLDAGVPTTAHHCCQVCRIDCEQMRYSCPRRNVEQNDSCAPKETEVETCRFSEDVLDVRARVLCAVKVAKSREIPTSWYYDYFSLRTSPRNCPYRRLEKGEHYVVMATLSTPNYGREDTLVGADMIVAVPKKHRSQLPTQYLRGVPGLSLLSVPYQRYNSSSNSSSAALISNRTVASRIGGKCPTEKALKALKLSSSAAALSRRSGRGHTGVAALWTVVAAAIAAAAGKQRGASDYFF